MGRFIVANPTKFAPLCHDGVYRGLTFDLRVLLTEKAGANLRNDVAHGLLADGDKIGAKIYFWWICLRFVLVPLLPPPSDAASQGESEAQEPKPATP